MRVSVVINTLNRAQSLRTTLDALRYQTHPHVEVIVVNGPSTDDTEHVLGDYRAEIKHLRCPKPNLSMSRNIGIQASAGDVVAFIDDDAIPEYDWLSELALTFEDQEVGAAGGVVFDHTGMGFQTRYAVADRLGHTTPIARHPDGRALCAPGAWTYPSLMGTNTAFRRDHLVALGGFDEVYEYYLDETDVLIRLMDAGWVIELVDGAPVHHHFLPSHIRNDQKVVRNWYPVVKNRVYFGLRHARDYMSERDVLADATRWADERLRESALAESSGALARGSTRRARGDVERALSDGTALGRDPASARLWPASAADEAFIPYPRKHVRTDRRMVLVTGDYPPRSMAGVARFMSDAAPALTELGCEVRVFTRATDQPSVAWEDGVWVHRLRGERRGMAGGTFEHIDTFATAVVDELMRISPLLPVASVYGAAWDVEALGVVRATDVPVAVMLVTPAKVGAEHAGWLDDPALAPAVHGLFGLERELFESADLVHGISQSIVGDVTALYGDEEGLFDFDRVVVFPLGARDRRREVAPTDAATSVTFVGRLERRKGIDVFLEAVERLAPRFPDVGFRIAGADPSASSGHSIAQAWRARHKRASWIGRVEFEGEVSDERLHELFASSSVVALPSRFESFGLVVVEAFMNGAAVVTSSVGGIQELAEAGVCAQLVAPGDAVGLAGAIADLLEHPDERRRLGHAARQRFESRLQIGRAAADLLELQSRLHRVESPERRELDGDEPIEVRTTVEGSIGLTISTSSSAIVSVETGSAVATTHHVSAPGRRLHVRVQRDCTVRVRLVEGEGRLVGVTGVALPTRWTN